MSKEIEILLTDKDNLFVKKENLLGFFTQEGKLLRRADEHEWQWATQRMKKIDPLDIDDDVKFDFKGLEKAQKEKEREEQREARLAQKERVEKIISTKREICKITNLSPALLEVVLEKSGCTDASEIKICGEMPMDWRCGYASSSGCAYTDRGDYRGWGFVSGSSFAIQEMDTITLDWGATQSANGDSSDEVGFSISSLISQMPKAMFFLIKFSFYQNIDHGGWNSPKIEEGESWSIWQVPQDFCSNQKNILEEKFQDLRWEFREKILPRMRREFGDQILNSVEICGELPADFYSGGVSTGGCAYSSTSYTKVWKVCERGILEIPSITTRVWVEQNPDGRWSNAYGFTSEYMASLNSQGIIEKDDLILVHQYYHRSADRQATSHEESWLLYSVRDFSADNVLQHKKEELEKAILKLPQFQNKPWYSETGQKIRLLVKNLVNKYGLDFPSGIEILEEGVAPENDFRDEDSFIVETEVFWLNESTLRLCSGENHKKGVFISLVLFSQRAIMPRDSKVVIHLVK